MKQRVQEQQLHHLRARGVVADRLYFHALQKDIDALAALAPEARTRPEDALVFDLLTGVPCEDLKGSVESTQDPWVFYSLAKGLLRANRLHDAYDVMETGLRRAPADVTTLNLLARFLVNADARDTARDLVEISLKIAPDQEDLVALLADLDAKRARRFRLYLDPMPRYAPTAFYLPVYKVERFIQRALEGVFSLNYPLEAVYVVDDGTPDASIRIAETFPVTVLRHDGNRGLAAARNTAFHAADTDYLGAIDTDAYPDPGYVKYAMMELENAGPEVVGVGGRLHELHTDTPADLWRALHLSQDPGPVRIHPPRFLYGSNTLHARQPVLDVGGYDERYRTNSEDGDIARKLAAAGFSFTVTPHARAFHMRRDDMDSVLRTLWGWAKAHRDACGIFDNLYTVLQEMPTTLNQAVNLINDDAGETSRHSAAYLDFLYVFHCTFLNLTYCIEEGRVAERAAHHIQAVMLDSLTQLDATHGGSLGKRVREDVAHLCVQAPPQDLDEEAVALLDAFMVELRKVYDAINAETYALLEG